MGRRLRPYLPGVPFHLTARLQGPDPLFRDAEAIVSHLITDAAARRDARLLAWAVMPNHLHIVAVQGQEPLSSFMQSLLSRIALLIRRRTRREGHVFVRRYSHSACLDPAYLRNAIAYVHLNPVRANLCALADNYRWSSHAGYCRPTSDDLQSKAEIARMDGLKLFASQDDQSLAACVADYRRFIEWRVGADRCAATSAAGGIAVDPERPPTRGGDVHWLRAFGRACHGIGSRRTDHYRMDLRDFALIVLRELSPDMPLDVLRSGGRTRALVRVRRGFIARAAAMGYRGGQVARFLHLSESAVCSSSRGGSKAS